MLAALAALLASFLVAGVGTAQNITTDGNLGAKVTLTGPNYPITADLGKQVGGNLFHSFGAFGLNKGESAVFSGPQTVTNVIGRVTGGTASSELGISGTIDIVGPRVDLNASLVVLSSELRSAAEVLRNSCAAQSGFRRSTLTEAGRGGLPQDPEARIPALYLAGRDAEPAPPAAGAMAQFAHRSSLGLTMHCGG